MSGINLSMPHVHEPALEDVVGEEGAEVPDVRKVVHCGAAAVEGHAPGLACVGWWIDTAVLSHAMQ